VAHAKALPEPKMVHLNYENGSPEPWARSPLGSILLMRRGACYIALHNLGQRFDSLLPRPLQSEGAGR
jgi:hypothetical protein